MTKCETWASHRNRISRNVFEIQNFTCPLQRLGLLGSLGQIPWFLTLIHSKVSTLGMWSCLGVVHTILTSIRTYFAKPMA